MRKENPKERLSVLMKDCKRMSSDVKNKMYFLIT